MAVTQMSDSNSEKPVEEPVQHCGGDGADPGPCGLIQQRKSDGPSTRPKSSRKDDCGVVRSHKLGGNRIKDDKSDRLSDIDDVEVVGYLRSKEEMHLKRILWEAMNERYVKAKKQKQAAETKKGVSLKKASKTTSKVGPERRSSRINYDVLKSLKDDLQESCESMGPDSCSHGSQNLPHGNSSHRMHGSNKSWHDEDETHDQYRDEDIFDDFDL